MIAIFETILGLLAAVLLMAGAARWLRVPSSAVLVAQAIQELARTPQRSGTPPVLLLLDEFAALGRLELLRLHRAGRIHDSVLAGLEAELDLEEPGARHVLAEAKVCADRPAPPPGLLVPRPTEAGP